MKRLFLRTLVAKLASDELILDLILRNPLH